MMTEFEVASKDGASNTAAAAEDGARTSESTTPSMAGPDVPLRARVIGYVTSIPRQVRSFYPPGSKDELIYMIKLAWPVVVAQFLTFFPIMVTLMFCGRLGKEEMDAVALALTIITLTGVSIGYGLTTALDTLFSQTFGADNPKRVGVVCQRGIYIIGLFCIGCWAFYLNTELILKAVKQSPEVAEMAADFVIVFIPGLPGFVGLQIIFKFLQNQNMIYPPVMISIFLNLLHPCLLALFIFGLKLDVKGAAAAFDITCWTGVVVSIVYIKARRLHENTWGGWSLDGLQEWGYFMHLAFPGLLMMGIESWNYEIGTFLSGLVGKTDLACQAIVYQLVTLCFMIPLGIGVSASIRIGQHLGGGFPLEAKMAARISISMQCFMGFVVGLILVAFKNLIPKAFTNESDVVDYVSRVLFQVALSQFFDGIQGVSSGIIRGCGRQWIGALVNFIGFYVIGMPLGLSLLFKTPSKVAGYWWGNAVATFVQSVAFTVIIYRIDWQLESHKAQVRAGVLEEKGENQEESTEKKEVDGETMTASVAQRSMKSENEARGFADMDQFSTDVEQPDVHLMSLDHLPVKQLVIRRSLALGAAVLLLIVGILIHALVKPPKSDVVPNTAQFESSPLGGAGVCLISESVNYFVVRYF